MKTEFSILENEICHVRNKILDTDYEVVNHIVICD